MAILTGALLAIWIVLCIMVGIFFTLAALSCLVCTISPAGSGVDRFEAFFGFIPCCLLTGLLFVHVWYLVAKPQETPETPETPATRDILLIVPEESSVNAQVTSGNNTVNIKNL